MDVADVAVLVKLVREHYAADRRDRGVTEPTLVEHDDGSRSVVLPRDHMFEPYRSFRLIDAAAVGSTLVITFTWDDGADDGTLFLMPLDTRDIELDMSDNIAVITFLSHHLEFTLGGPRRVGKGRALRRSGRGFRSSGHSVMADPTRPRGCLRAAPGWRRWPSAKTVLHGR